MGIPVEYFPGISGHFFPSFPFSTNESPRSCVHFCLRFKISSIFCAMQLHTRRLVLEKIYYYITILFATVTIYGVVIQVEIKYVLPILVLCSSYNGHFHYGMSAKKENRLYTFSNFLHEFVFNFFKTENENRSCY